MSGGGDSKTVSQQVLSPEQKQLIGMVVPSAQSYLETPLKMFGKSTNPWFNPMQRAAQKGLVKAGQTVGNIGGYGTNAAARLTQAGTSKANAGLGAILADYRQGNKTRDMFNSGALLNPESNPALRKSIAAAVRPITQQLNRNVLPGIRSDFIGGNSFGSSRQGIAQGLAMQGASNATADATANVMNNAYNQGLGATLSSLNAQTGAASSGVGQGYYAGLGGLQQLPGMAQLAYAPSMAQSAVGQQQYALGQKRLQEQKQNFTTAQMLPFLQAQDVASLAMGLGGGSAVTKAQQPSFWDTLFSDRRLKTNVEYSHTDDKGNRWYTYTFGGIQHLGVMADEVDPAIVTNVGGYYMVDYSKL